MTINIEMTDLFQGESNYSWVKRRTIETDKELTDRQIIRRVKKELEVSCRHTKEDFGDMIKLDLTRGGWLAVIFITFE
jgi:hypothetical protein